MNLLNIPISKTHWLALLISQQPNQSCIIKLVTSTRHMLFAMRIPHWNHGKAFYMIHKVSA